MLQGLLNSTEIGKRCTTYVKAQKSAHTYSIVFFSLCDGKETGNLKELPIKIKFKTN